MTGRLSGLWLRVHRWRWWLRWPLKLAVLTVTVGLVLYPKFWLLPVWWQRTHNIEQLLEPDHPGLADLEQQVRVQGGARPVPSPALLQLVEQTVYQRVPYAYDWEVWGVMDYVPTVAEVFEKGREDCDGRAVVAASLLRRLGCDAWLVSDLVHVWVATPQGETMHPGRGEKTLVADGRGTHARLSWQTASNLGRGLSFGIGVFPLARELVILAAVVGLSWGPGGSTGRRAAGCALLVVGFALLRFSGQAVAREVGTNAWFWLGMAAAGIGWLLLVIRAAARRLRSPAKPSE